jgi:hypothetical protein
LDKLRRHWPVLVLFTYFAIFITLSNQFDWDYFFTTAEVDLRAWLADHELPLWSYQFCGGVTRIGDPQAFGLSPLFLPVFLFGSYAKGTANKDSDVDVAVVIDGFEKMDEIKVMADFYSKTKKINSLMEPFCISYKDYRYAQPTSILAGIIRSGVLVK